jgi:hypothetical protein
VKPVDMILYCPNCGMQHIDAPEPPRMEQVPSRFAQMHSFQLAPTWDNPPHKSHLCHGCRCVWRPADVATNGVAELQTSGKGDTWPAIHNDEVRAIPARGVDSVHAAEAEVRTARDAMGYKIGRLPNLWPVIRWLEGGCDPTEAAKELRIYAERINACGVQVPHGGGE